MASFDTQVLRKIASKLGIDSESVIKKASEYVRLLQLRISGSSVRQLSDTLRLVLCLDLACSTLNVSFFKDESLRIAGANKKSYSNGRHLLEKLLNLSTPPTVRSLCVQLGVNEVADFAEKLLYKYKELRSKGQPLDLSLPMYSCVAVSVACNHRKVKVNKSELQDISRITTQQFKKLVNDFAPALEEIGSTETKKTATKRSHKLIELVEKYSEDTESEKPTMINSKTKEEEEDFESWKKRILGDDVNV